MAKATDTVRLWALLKAATIKGPLILREQSGVHNQRIESADICQMDRPDMTVASLHIVVWKPGSRDARPNAKLIVEAVNALPVLLEELERLRAVKAMLDTAADESRDEDPNLLAENERLTDLCRHARHYLYDENLIDNQEFADLVADSDNGHRVARLEGYDAMRKENERLRAALRKISTWRTYEEGAALPVTPSELREIAREAMNDKG